VNIHEQLIRDEGSVPYAYQDTLGYWTIGVGHMIDRRRGGALPQPIIDALLGYDITEVNNNLSAHLPWFEVLDEARQAALINIAFNVGPSGMLAFHSFLTYMAANDFTKAAADLRTTKVYQQLPARYERIAKQIESGVWV